MTEFKGTAGPWEFVPADPDDLDGNHDGRHMGGFRGPDGWVCDFGDAMTYYPTEGTPPELEDARLIAAAPELLEGSFHVARWLEACLKCPDYRWDADQREEAEGVLGFYREVIAKATGRDA